VALAALLGLAGCKEKIEPVEPIPAAGPVPLNQFVRAWDTTPTLDEGDRIKELHPRDGRLFAYTRGGQVLVMASDTAPQVPTGDPGPMPVPKDWDWEGNLKGKESPQGNPLQNNRGSTTQ
jgi:hypothetical protein